MGCSPPPSRGTPGGIFHLWFPQLAWVLPLGRCSLGCQPSPPQLRLSGCPLSLQLSLPYSQLSSSLFLVVTGDIRIFQLLIHPLMHDLDASSVLIPGVIGCFGPFNRHPLPGDPTEVDQASACVQVAFFGPHTSPLFSYIHLDARSAASMLLLIALLRLAPVIPIIL